MAFLDFFDPIGEDPPPYPQAERERDKQRLIRVDIVIAEVSLLNRALVKDLFPSWTEFLMEKLYALISGVLSVICTLAGAGPVATLVRLIREILILRNVSSQMNRQFQNFKDKVYEEQLPNAGGGRFYKMVRSRNP